jgi:hypothetical protein
MAVRDGSKVIKLTWYRDEAARVSRIESANIMKNRKLVVSHNTTKFDQLNKSIRFRYIFRNIRIELPVVVIQVGHFFLSAKLGKLAKLPVERLFNFKTNQILHILRLLAIKSNLEIISLSSCVANWATPKISSQPEIFSAKI